MLGGLLEAKRKVIIIFVHYTAKKKNKQTKKQKTIQAQQFLTGVRKTKQLMGVKNVYTLRKFTGFRFRNLIRCK